MIDVHVLHLSDENLEWQRQCDESLQGHPIVEHHISGVVGSVSDGRKIGWAQGKEKYVSFVDPDDIVEPGTFQLCYDTLERNPDVGGVFTNSALINEKGDFVRYFRPLLSHSWSFEHHKQDFLQVHPIAVIRRELVEHFVESPPFEITDMLYEQLMYSWIAKEYGWIRLPIIGYQWRQKWINIRQKTPHDIIHEGLEQISKYLDS